MAKLPGAVPRVHGARDQAVRAVGWNRKRKRSKRKPKPPARLVAWSCVVLAVDPGEKCGVAIFWRGGYVDSRAIDGYDPKAIAYWITNANWYANALSHLYDCKVPVVLVLEKPPRGGQAFEGRSPAGPASVIGCRKLWQHMWRELAKVKRLRCDVYPVSWRAAMLGMVGGPLLKRMEGLRANAIAGKHMHSHDEAVAVLIGAWASRAGEVGLVLNSKGKRHASVAESR